MADSALEEWSASSNDALHISLVAPSEKGVQTLHTFNPKMSYSIFGDEETIFGYQGLKINLRFNASDMRPSVQTLYTKKFKTVGETSPSDIKEILEPFLPKNAFSKSADFDAAVNSTDIAWKPSGELIKSTKQGGQTHEIWKGSLLDPTVKQLVKRIQILIPLFIEGGNAIDLEDSDDILSRWSIFFLYQKSANPAPKSSPYTFLGYSTVFRYYWYQPVESPSTPPARKPRLERKVDFQLPLPEVPFHCQPCRSRISQFIILPPFQSGGNGSRFYNAIFDHYSQEPATIEITVEDPNTQFDDLRDVNDLIFLRKLPEFSNLRINPKSSFRRDGPAPRDIVDAEEIVKIRNKHKIAPRQSGRVIEMQLLSLIPIGIRKADLATQERVKISGEELKAKKHEYRLWQLFVKQRLYKHNKDLLIQLDRPDRLEKLDEALSGVEMDYSRLISVALRREGGNFAQSNGLKASTNGQGAVKRPSPFPEEAEEEIEPSAKKIKFT